MTGGTGAGSTRKYSRSGNSLYELFGIKKDATSEDIKKAYRKLALKNHPDKNRDDPESAERFKEINRANTILSDGTKRGIYDRYGSMGIYAAEQFGEENVNTYLVLTSGWCKALAIFCCIITGCYCCCCCFFCCGKCRPMPMEEDGNYTNLHDESSTPDEPITTQPVGDEEEEEKADERTNFNTTGQPTYGADEIPPPVSSDAQESKNIGST